MLKAAAVGVFLLAAPSAAAADALYDTCIETHENNFDWSQCGADLLKREDARLNAVWKRVYGKQAGATKDALLAEQRLWIAYKDKSCLYFQSDDFGREGQVLHFPACRAEIIVERIKVIEALEAMTP